MKLFSDKMLLSPEEKKDKKIQSGLVALWQRVFGDEEEYIKLILPYLGHFDCYAVVSDGTVVSAMYLLPSEIRTGNGVFKGKYLYAAATDERYRKNGYMSKLIREAIENNKDEIDFISLVPANEGLYSYYARFGFESAMCNYETVMSCEGKDRVPLGEEINDGKALNELRKSKLCNAHLYDDKTMEYALSCYGFYGSHYRKVKNSALLFVRDENTVYEGIFSEEEKTVFSEIVKSFGDDEIKVLSPYRLNENSEKVKCGMVCAFNDELKNEKEIYNNLTLM